MKQLHIKKPIVHELGKAVMSYSPISNQHKHKNTHIAKIGLATPNINHITNLMSKHQSKAQFSQLYYMYQKLLKSAEEQKNRFLEGSLTMQKAITNFYKQLACAIQRVQKQARTQIKVQRQYYQKYIEDHMRQVQKKMIQVYTCNKITQLMRTQYSQLCNIQLPYYKIQGNPIQQFSKIQEQFKLVFLYNDTVMTKSHQNQMGLRKSGKREQMQPKQNGNLSQISLLKQLSMNSCIQKSKHEHRNVRNQQHDMQNTIKKPTKVARQPQKNTSIFEICQFTCDQQLQWNQRGSKERKVKQHQIVSEIILQQPSSCEDSIMMNDGP